MVLHVREVAEHLVSEYNLQCLLAARQEYKIMRNPIFPGFMGFKKLCPGVPQNLVRNAKCLELFQIIKI